MGVDEKSAVLGGLRTELLDMPRNIVIIITVRPGPTEVGEQNLWHQLERSRQKGVAVLFEACLMLFLTMSALQ